MRNSWSYWPLVCCSLRFWTIKNKQAALSLWHGVGSLLISNCWLCTGADRLHLSPGFPVKYIICHPKLFVKSSIHSCHWPGQNERKINYAVTYYNLPFNPCDRAGHMGKRTRSMKFWTLGQYNTFSPHITDITARTALQVLFYSGMRFGELLAFTLSDLNFNANTAEKSDRIIVSK